MFVYILFVGFYLAVIFTKHYRAIFILAHLALRVLSEIIKSPKFLQGNLPNTHFLFKSATCSFLITFVVILKVQGMAYCRNIPKIIPKPVSSFLKKYFTFFINQKTHKSPVVNPLSHMCSMARDIPSKKVIIFIHRQN